MILIFIVDGARAVISFWWCNDLNFLCGWGKGSDFLLHTVSNSRVHGGSSRQDSVSIQIFSDINITFHDGMVCGFMDTARFHSQERWLEECFRASESFLISTSHFMMELYVVSWIPQDSIPKKDGWKSASGHRNLSFPIVIT